MKTLLCQSALLLALGAAVVVPAFGATSAETKTQSETQSAIDLNAASAQELTALPGIGQTVAERIVAYRESNGPFQKKEELMNVRGIGEKTFLKLESLVRVGPQSESKKR